MLKADKKLVGYLYLSLASIFSVIEYLIVQYITQNLSLSPLSYAFLTFISSTILISPFIIYFYGYKNLIKIFIDNKKGILITSLTMSIGSSLWFYMIARFGASTTSFMENFVLIFSILLGTLFLKEKLNLFEVIGVALCLIGSIILSMKNFVPLWDQILIGILTYIFISLYSFFVRIYCTNIPSFVFNFFRMWIMLLVFGILNFSFGSLILPSINILILALIAGISGIVFCMSAIIQSHKYLQISNINAFYSICPVFVSIASFLVFKEIPGIQKVIGGLIIILGSVIIVGFRKEN